jgi:uroporphyrinogen III methyltransferase/synthase
MQRLWETGGELRRLAHLSIVAVGSKTAAALGEFHLRPDFVPEEFSAESLAKALSNRVRGKRVLILRASRGRDLLEQSLREWGADVQQLVCYRHEDASEVDPHVQTLAEAGQIDWVTITSSESAVSLSRLLGSSLAKMKIASLSPVTSDSIRRLGLAVAVEASPYTMEALIDSIKKAET